MIEEEKEEFGELMVEILDLQGWEIAGMASLVMLIGRNEETRRSRSFFGVFALSQSSSESHQSK